MFSLVTSLVLACGNYLPNPEVLERALDGSPQEIAQLRASGEPGFDELFEHYRGLGKSDPRWEALIDEVAGQRYAFHSGLYWYTDLEAARSYAAATGRGVLSLRLLGRLDEDLSCANSRFFRTMLYPDSAIADALRKHFVLHWEPVREAPVITIDFGGGKKLVRTITGNSLHYAMTAAGEVVDVMPGLVAPAAFHEWLVTTGPVARRIGMMPVAERREAILAHHGATRTAIFAKWAELTKPRALRGPQSPLLAEPELFDRLAAAYPVTLSNEARELVTRLMPDTTTPALPGYRPSLARRAMPIASGKSGIEMPMLDRLEPVLANLGRDDLKNRFELRLRVLALASQVEETAALTARIYEEVFATPLDDPWMGLAPSDVFTGLPAPIERVGSAIAVGPARSRDERVEDAAPAHGN